MTRAVYLLAGEAFLAGEALDKIRSEAETDPLSEAVFDASAAAAEILGALETPSLLGGRRLVVINDADALKKEQIEAIERYLESPSPDSVLVLVAGGRSKLAAAAKRHGAVVPLDPPKGRRLSGWLRNQARAHGLRLDDQGARALVDSVGQDLRELDGALQQLATALGHGATAGASDVRGMFARLADERVYQLTDAIGERRLAAATEALRRLLDQGEEPLVLFGALTGHLRRLLVARSYADGGARAIADALQMPDWRAERLYRQARSYREEELIRAAGVLAATDVEIKGGDLPPALALERAVIDIVSGENLLGADQAGFRVT